jgi:hypothetical protein
MPAPSRKASIPAASAEGWNATAHAHQATADHSLATRKFNECSQVGEPPRSVLRGHHESSEDRLQELAIK